MSHNPFQALSGSPRAIPFAQAIIFKVLEDRFGAIPEELPERVRGITDLDRLGSIYLVSALCEDFEAFLAQTNLAISFPQKVTRITGPWVAGWKFDHYYTDVQRWRRLDADRSATTRGWHMECTLFSFARFPE